MSDDRRWYEKDPADVWWARLVADLMLVAPLIVFIIGIWKEWMR